MNDSASAQWTKTTLGEVVRLQRGHDLPSSRRIAGPIPVIGSGEPIGWHVEARAKGPGVVIGRATNLGRPKFISGDYWPLNTTLYVTDFLGNEPRWVYYLFQTLDLSAYNSGSVQPMLNRNYVRAVPVVLPPVAEQRAIAEVLGALDDKIDANDRTLSSLDALVRAEVAGAQGVAEGEIPLGDLVGRVNDIAKPASLNETTLYVGLEHMTRGSIFLREWGSGAELVSAKSRFESGDILFGKLRPYFKKVAVASGAGVCSTDVLVLRPKVAGQAAFTSAVCASDEVIAYASAGSHGTRMPRVSWDYLAHFKVRWPAAAELEALDLRLAPLVSLGIGLPWQSVTLARLRDTLLPKLLTGELKVRAAEALVEEAV